MIEATYAAELRLLVDGVPDIDDYSLDPDDIWRLGECLVCQGRHAGRVMFPSRPRGYVTATHNLGHYAYNKATAMRCRIRGDISGAMVYEAICQQIYGRLPELARW